MSKLKLCSNRLFVAAGIVVLCAGIKLAFKDIDVESARQFIVYRGIQDLSSTLTIWLGLALIFDKDE